MVRDEETKALNPGGNGLGLHISQSIAKAMKGSIDVQSTPGAGSTFTLSLIAKKCELPQAANTDHQRQQSDPQNTSARKTTEESPEIIVAEDSRINMEALQISMREIGLYDSCEFVTDGRQAIHAAKQLIRAALSDEDCKFPITPIRAMLLDQEMPHRKGTEVV